MLESLGKRAFVVPFMIPLVIALVLGCAIGPVLSASMTNIPFAIVTLDKGSTLPIGDVNVGDELAQRLLDGEGLDALQDDGKQQDSAFGNATIIWTQLDSEESLRQALADNQYYGGIIIPSNFTSQQMAAATGLGGAPTITVLVNDAKNPMLAQQMGPNIKSAMLQAGISVDVEEVNAADVGGGTMAPMMMVQMMVMPLVIMTLIGSLLLSVVFWPREGASRRLRVLALAKQLVAGCILSALIAALAIGIELWIGGLQLPVGQLYPLLWLASACMMLVIVGLANLALPLGALVGITTFALGMSCAMLAFEMLPSFWQQWVYPWVPQQFLGNDLRAIIYLGADFGELHLAYWATLAAIGLVAAVLATIAPQPSPAAPDSADGMPQPSSPEAHGRPNVLAAIKERKAARHAAKPAHN